MRRLNHSKHNMKSPPIITIVSILLTFSLSGLASGLVIKQTLKSGVYAQPRLSGGQEAREGQFPSYVSLAELRPDNTSGVCGGVLISDQLVLTAAHCVSPTKGKIFAAPGIWGAKRWAEKGVGAIRVEKACVSGLYKSDWFTVVHNDFAILRLEKKLKLGADVNVAQLPKKPVDYGTEVWTIGTGKTDKHMESAADRLKVLRSVRVDCDTFRLLENYNPVRPHKSLICFKSSDTGEACQGDSGGPTLMEVDGKQSVYGLASFGPDVSCPAADRRTWVSADVYGGLKEIRKLIEHCS